MSGTGNTSVVFFGLDEGLSSELQDVLESRRWAIYTHPFLSPLECLNVVDRVGAGLVFCSAERGRYLALLETIGRERPGLPVIIVTRAPEVSEWLDAMEAGASDYCAAPFEPSHIHWILDSVLKYRPGSARGAGG
jgi:DNA-binding NtrC family response regulator